jgi:hypothetical protein
VISKEQGQALANEYGLKFMETSAKPKINTDEAFFTLARYPPIVVIGLWQGYQEAVD